MRRRWIGIDITYLAVDLIRKRLRHTYGDETEQTYIIHGIPADAGGAAALFAENPFDPTQGMRDDAGKAGNSTSGLTGQTYPKIPILTVHDLRTGTHPHMPTAILPYLKAKPRDPDQLTLDAG
ncbi:MAG: hypothetical protein MUP67_15700 [Acidimicrobiia bacterium]|nr:hypothetical protein [Acidimicrobiia bacterium]